MKRPIPGACEAMPAENDKCNDEQVADAMRALEEAVIDLMHMTRIANAIAERLLNRPDTVAGDTLIFHIGHGERETFLFSLNNVEQRARDLKANYMRAWDGEKAR